MTYEYYSPERVNAIVEKFFKNPYLVRMKYIYTIPDHAYGCTSMPVYEDEEDAVEASEFMMNVTRTAYELMCLYREAKDFTILDRADIKRIFDNCMDYCNMVKFRFDNSVYLANAPIADNDETRRMWQDFNDTVNFINMLYPHVSATQEQQTQIQGYLSRLIAQPVQQPSVFEQAEVDPLTGNAIVYNPLDNMDISILERFQNLGRK